MFPSGHGYICWLLMCSPDIVWLYPCCEGQCCSRQSITIRIICLLIVPGSDRRLRAVNAKFSRFITNADIYFYKLGVKLMCHHHLRTVLGSGYASSVLCDFFPIWRCSPTRAMASSFLGFIGHTQQRTAVGRTPLDEWSIRRKNLYLTIYNTHNRKTSMPPARFELKS